MHEINMDAPAIMRRRRRIARQTREKTPEPIAKTGGIRLKYSDEESSSTTDFNIKPTALTSNVRNNRIKSKTTTSTSSGGGCGGNSNNSNIAYRNKILSRRDRGSAAQPAIVRSHSTPRSIEAEPKSDGEQSAERRNSGGSNVLSFLRQAKRSLSIPRRHRDVACETLPVRGNDQLVKRYARMPISKPNANQATILNVNNEREMSKLEMNLRRFEEERRRFEHEKEKFEREKKQIEQIKFQRLIEFERKRSIQRKEREQLAAEAAAKELVEREIQRLAAVQKIRSKSKFYEKDIYESGDRLDRAPERKRTHSSSRERFNEDYESSTALSSSSSRDADFDYDEDNGIEEEEETLVEESQPLIKLSENKFSVTKVISVIEPTVPVEPPKQSLLSRIFFGKRKIRIENHLNGTNYRKSKIQRQIIDDGKPISVIRILFVESPIVWEQLLDDHRDEWEKTKLLRNRCIADFIALSIYFGIGGLVFRFVEGAFENFYKCGVRRVKRDFVDQLWLSSHNLREDDWKSLARSKLRGFEEELHAAHEAGMTSYSGMKAWTFVNGVIYCMTIVTTIGYGHISPATNIGRALTIAYAIIGIPMFLILLADFGKLFTRSIKFVWAYVRRLYYTGSLRRVRKQAQVQEVLRGMNIAYEIATFRRPSMMMKAADLEPNSANLAPPSTSETPTTPIPPEIDIDDEFNLPISLAFVILLAYVFCGAAVYYIWEEWSFFESCYFVFVSMSTIGFGDYVPKHPMRMMASIIYLIFGLSLTSMCINVVQVKLSDSFKQASAKIGATIGLTLAEEEARSSQNLTPVPENVSVHSYSTRPDSRDDPKMDNNSFKFNPTIASDYGTYDNAEFRGGAIAPENTLRFNLPSTSPLPKPTKMEKKEKPKK